MKKWYTLVVLGLMLLTACSVKKTPSKSTKSSTEPLASATPIWSQSEDESTEVVTKKLTFPEQEGVSQSQIVTYRGKEWISFTMEQIQPSNDEIKKAISEVGVEETQKAIDESLTKDDKYMKAKDLPGFAYSVKLTDDQKLKLMTTYDLKVLNLEEMKKLEYFNGSNLSNILELTPSKYIANRVDHGAKVE